MQPTSLNGKEKLLAVSGSTASLDLTGQINDSCSVTIYNPRSEPVFCVAGVAGGSAVLPTTSTFQNGKTIAPQSTQSFMWPSSDLTHLHAIQFAADAGNIHVNVNADGKY
jgi:hypothetical protein